MRGFFLFDAPSRRSEAEIQLPQSPVALGKRNSKPTESRPSCFIRSSHSIECEARPVVAESARCPVEEATQRGGFSLFAVHPSTVPLLSLTWRRPTANHETDVADHRLSKYRSTGSCRRFSMEPARTSSRPCSAGVGSPCD